MKLNCIGLNQTELVLNDKSRLFFSYSVPVVFINAKNQAFKTSKKYSATTTKHINKYLNGKNAEYKNQEFFDNII